MPDQEEFNTKATVRINNELYNTVKKELHYGQFSLLFRNFFLALKIKIKKDKFMDVINFIYGNSSLTLDRITKDNVKETDDVKEKE